MNIHYYTYDLPSDFSFHTESIIAIDTEAMGLLFQRDRLCVVQLCAGDGNVYIIHFPTPDFSKSPRLVSLLKDTNVLKLFHFARFDVALLQHTFNIKMTHIYCTKIASRLVRTYTDKHSLKDLCKALLGIEMSKEEQTSDWGAKSLTLEQQTYAANDVLYLHRLKEHLDHLLKREGREALAKECFDFLPTRAYLDILCTESFDIFSHKS